MCVYGGLLSSRSSALHSQELARLIRVRAGGSVPPEMPEVVVCIHGLKPVSYGNVLSDGMRSAAMHRPCTEANADMDVATWSGLRIGKG